MVAAGVADVRLNRPEKLNALDPGMFEAIVEAADALATDRSVRAVVLSGEGRSFCAGLDFASFEQMADGQRAAPAATGRSLSERMNGRITNLAQQSAYAWTELAVPVIAAIQGHALGGGLQIALAADIRIVSPDARLSVLEIRWGLVPDMTGTQLLPRLVSLDVAKELTWTGRMISGEEAVSLGLATSLSDDPRAAAFDLAAQLAKQSPDALAASKRLLNRSGAADEATQFLEETAAAVALVGSPTQREAVRAAMERRDAEFGDRRPAPDNP
jgi:enoyl-CoA hydratase/carnithine racemase